jgi:Golgi nucleoside diphosphatase
MILMEHSFVIILVLCTVAVMLFLFSRTDSASNAAGVSRYGVMIDAGSSGTRLHVFRHWRDSSTGHVVVVPVHYEHPQRKSALKVTPGLSDLAAVPKAKLASYLSPLIAFAVAQVPADAHETTTVYLKGTAGLRLVPYEQRERVLELTREVFVESSPFDVRSFTVVDGNDEGMFLWKTVDSLQKRAGINAPLVGSLDMGGGSLQIAFPHAGDTYVHSFLKYGVNEARYRAYAAIVRAADTAHATTLQDPCLPRGSEISLPVALSTRATDDGSTEVVEDPDAAQFAGRSLVGTGAFDECLALAKRLLERDVECRKPPCSMAGIHQPPLPLNAVFFARDHYVRVVVHFLNQTQTPSLNEVETAARAVCALDDITYRNTHRRAHLFYCFEAAWILSVLRDGFGFPPTSRQVRFHDDIGGISTSWALGAMAHEIESTSKNHNEL